MATLEKAIELAARAHAGQVDKANQPYILHPLRLMFAVQTTDEKITAVLHDIVEDTPITFDDLAAAGFTSPIIDAVRALTKLPDETRLQAAHRAAANPIARTVKLADVTDNMDLTRLPQPTERDFARLQEYAQVRQILLHAPHS
jgi:(p)ppGpp synthase/HD superfamily hydrolase